MKKNIFGIKGFAMSELLAASIVILLLFSILFANYLPLVSEFENRSLYTNVTANYGAFYVRKIYIEALEYSDIKETLDEGLTTNSYYTAYKSSNSNQFGLVSGKLERQLIDIINEYDIEEIIISNYKLDDLKGKNQNGSSRRKYEKSSGSLYNYIKYLPYHTLSKYEKKISEPYRIILKSKYGYATTQILPDPLTPVDCFEFDNDSLDTGKFIITNYNQECGKIVDITPYEISLNIRNTVKKGRITSITGDEKTGKGAFEGKQIEKINLSRNITSIGDNAFKDNNIKEFKLKYNAPGVTTVGNYAFKNNKLTDITIPNKLIKIGKGAFANNYSLESIKFEYDSSTQDIVIPAELFALDYNTSKLKNNLIDLSIPSNITSIGDSAFKNIQFSSIKFENEVGSGNSSKLKTIKTSAFELDERLFDNKPENYIALSIPSTVETIYANAFKNVKIGGLVLETNQSADGIEHSNLRTIGNSAFKVKTTDQTKINKQKFCNLGFGNNTGSTCQYIRKVKIPINVRTIGVEAFKNQALSEVVFDTDQEDSLLHKLEDGAFSGNSLTKFKIPKKLTTSETVVGKKIFGDNYTLGNNTGSIYIEMDLSNDQNWNNTWCKAFYGDSGCTSPVTKSGTSSVYKNGSNTKYITYINY